MNTVMIILMAVLCIALALFLIVGLPVLFGRLFLKWSKERAKFIFSQSFSEIVASVVLSLIISGIILLVGLLLKKDWAFSGGLLFLYTFYTAIKTVRANIKASRAM